MITKHKIKEEIQGSLLSMSKYKEGEIKEALDEFIDLLYTNLNLNDLTKKQEEHLIESGMEDLKNDNTI